MIFSLGCVEKNKILYPLLEGWTCLDGRVDPFRWKGGPGFLHFWKIAIYYLDTYASVINRLYHQSIGMSLANQARNSAFRARANAYGAVSVLQYRWKTVKIAQNVDFQQNHYLGHGPAPSCELLALSSGQFYEVLG